MHDSNCTILWRLESNCYKPIVFQFLRSFGMTKQHRLDPSTSMRSLGSQCTWEFWVYIFLHFGKVLCYACNPLNMTVYMFFMCLSMSLFWWLVQYNFISTIQNQYWYFHFLDFWRNRKAQAIANALVSECSGDVPFVFPNEKRPPQFKQLLGAVCQQLWATIESDGNPEKDRHVEDVNKMVRQNGIFKVQVWKHGLRELPIRVCFSAAIPKQHQTTRLIYLIYLRVNCLIC